MKKNKEPTEQERMQERLELLNKRLTAIETSIKNESDMTVTIGLIRVRSNIIYKQKALRQRLSNSTRNHDVIMYNIIPIV